MTKENKTYSSPRIEKHPDYAEIVQRMCNAESVKDIEKWLKAKYPDQRSRRISWVTLQKFRKFNLNISGQVLKDLKAKRAAVLRKQKAQETKALIESSNAYQDKLNEVADNVLDVPNKILHMTGLVDDRLRYYFNMVSAIDEDDTVREDRVIMELIEKQRQLYTDWKKLIEGLASPDDQVSLGSAIVSEQLFKIKEAIRRVIDKMNPDLAIEFTENLCTELDNLQAFDDELSFETLNKRADKVIIDVGFEESI
jgi:hypothetical protein